MKKLSRWLISMCLVLAVLAGGAAGALAAKSDVWSGVSSIEDVEAVYHFTLDGAEYALPCQISDFTGNGWEARANLEQEMIPGMTCMSCRFEKQIGEEDEQVTLYLLNGGGDAMKADACRVTGIGVDSYGLNDGSLFKTAHGVQLGDSMEDAYAIYGAGDEQDPTKNRLSYSFVEAYQGPSNNIFSFLSYSFDTDRLVLSNYTNENAGRIIDIEMDYYKSMPDDKQEISPRPAYLDAYVSPEGVSDRIEDMTFLLDGTAYQIPLPVSELLEVGWQIDEESVPGLQTAYTQLEMDPEDYTAPYLSVVLENDSEKMVAAEDTYIEEVSVSSSSNLAEGAFSLGQGIMIGMTREELVAAVPVLAGLAPEDSVEQDGYEYRLSYDGAYYYISPTDNYFTKISISIDDEDDTVDRITLSARFPAAE